MSDLISRDELIKRFCINKDGHRIPERDCDNFEVTVSVKDVKTIINEQPTAYDVDKVVEELELHSFELGTDTLPAHYVRLNDAIEIVKQGSDADDVCKWKLDDDNLITSCDDYFNLYDNCTEKFKYCPRCGKKIKVVE